MHRTKIKKLTPEAALLKKLRESRKLSLGDVAEAVNKSVSWISHVENGRMNLSTDHIKLLLPLYGQTERSFKSYLNGAAFLESTARKECMDMLQELPDNIVESIHPIIQSFRGLLKGSQS